MLETNDVKWGSGFFLSVSRITLKIEQNGTIFGVEAESGQRKMRSNMDCSRWGCRKKKKKRNPEKFPHGLQGSWAVTPNAVESFILNFVKRESKGGESRNAHAFKTYL